MRRPSQQTPILNRISMLNQIHCPPIKRNVEDPTPMAAVAGLRIGVRLIVGSESLRTKAMSISVVAICQKSISD
jgi:hypothetical protein